MLFCFEQRVIILVLVSIATKFEIKQNSFAKFLQPAKFQTNQIKDCWDIALSFFHYFAGLRL